MSRLTGSDAKGLMEAYQAVYAPQELTEEQVWEEVENWVNSLIEEGYDLSEYTWDEMYKAYVTEAIPLAIPAAMAAAPYVLPALGVAAGVAKGLMNRNRTKNTPDEERFLSTGSFQARTNKPKATKPPTGQTTKAPSPTAQPAAKPETVKPRPQDVNFNPVNAGVKLRSPGPKIEVSTPKPETPKPETPKPELTAKDLGGEITRQSTTPGQSSASSTGGGGGGKPPGFVEKLRQRMQSDTARKNAEREARRAEPNPIGQAVQDKSVDLTARGMDKLATATKNVAKVSLGAGVAGAIDQGLLGGVGGKVARDLTNLTKQAGPAYDKLKGGVKVTTPTPTPTPQPLRILNGKVVGYEKNHFDMFDAIKGHLIHEGYADTNEAALAIMANMSEEWRESIIEETKRTQYLQKKFNKENERKSGSSLKYIPGKQNTGQALQKARQSERHMRGDT
jgi:hypothetical protein